MFSTKFDRSKKGASGGQRYPRTELRACSSLVVAKYRGFKIENRQLKRVPVVAHNPEQPDDPVIAKLLAHPNVRVLSIAPQCGGGGGRATGQARHQGKRCLGFRVGGRRPAVYASVLVPLMTDCLYICTPFHSPLLTFFFFRQANSDWMVPIFPESCNDTTTRTPSLFLFFFCPFCHFFHKNSSKKLKYVIVSL
jgi:hypothetical protein